MERLIVIGAGAVGAYIGGRLLTTGRAVTLVSRWREQVAAVTHAGLRVEERDPARNAILWPDIFDPDEAVRRVPPESADAVLICVKHYDLAYALGLARHWLKPDGYVACVQNGLVDDQAVEAVGPGRVVGIVLKRISVEATGPGGVRRNVERDGTRPTFVVGNYAGGATGRVDDLIAALGTIDKAVLTDDLASERWGKLCLNAMRGGPAAVSGLGTDRLDGSAAGRAVTIRLAAEALATAEAEGYRVATVGPLPAAMLRDVQAGDPDALAAAGGLLAGARSAAHLPSLAQDILAGRRSESDSIYGTIIAHGTQAALPLPVTRALHGTLKSIEEGGLRPEPGHLDAIARGCVPVRTVSVWEGA